MDRLKDIIKKHGKIITICLFFLLYLFGIPFLNDVGLNYDEHAEQEILEMNLLEYTEVFNKESDFAKYYRNKGIVPIYESVERDHGIAGYYLFAPFLNLNKISEHTLSYAWHFYTYTLFFAGVVLLYFLIKELWNNKTVALLVSLIYFFTPRIFADGLYNNKDCILLTFTILSMLYGIKFIKNKTYKSAIAFGLVSSFACNLKISGFYIFAIIGLFYLIELTIHKKWNKKNFLVGCTAIISCLFLFILITPAIWGHGFHLIEYFEWCLSNTLRFSRNWGRVWFEGLQYENSTNPLPWYYLPKIIFLTLPIYIFILFILSLIIKGKELLKKEKNNNTFYILLCLSLIVIPIFIAMMTHPNIYNGWRHFYFIYIPILCIISYGIFRIINYSKIKKVSFFIILTCIIGNCVGIILNSTSSSMYYNILAKNPSQNYEMDYYGVMSTKVLRSLSKENKEPIYLYGFDAWAIEINYNILSSREKEKIILLKNEEELNIALENGIKPYYYQSNSYYQNNPDSVEKMSAVADFVSDKEKVYEYKSWGNTYATIYK